MRSLALSQPLGRDGSGYGGFDSDAEAEEADEVAHAIAEGEAMLRGSLAAVAGVDEEAAEAMLPEAAWARLHEVSHALHPLGLSRARACVRACACV